MEPATTGSNEGAFSAASGARGSKICIDRALLGWAVVILICILAVWAVFGDPLEGYASRAEKDETIRGWFEKNPAPEYARYKREVPRSDIVEYLDARRLYAHA